MPQVLNWKAPDAQPAEIIDACLRALKAGQIIVFSTESAYFAVADPTSKTATPKLQQLLSQSPKYPVFEAFPLPDQPVSLVEGGSLLARRFARRVWPGPVAITTSLGKGQPPVTRYIPNSIASRQLMQTHGKTLTFAGLTTAAGEPVITLEQVQERVGDQVSVIVDWGKTHFAHLPTVIEIEGNSYRLAYEGVVTEKEVAVQASWLIIFVCTGNTCRSPLAEVMMKRIFADMLGCETEDLSKRGIRVSSMGISALPGNTATSEALIVAREMKTDLSAHRSRPLMPEILELADHVLAMTRIHRDSIAAIHPAAAQCVRLLCGTTDLSDPIGGDLPVYRTCAKTMHKHLEKLAGEILKIGPAVRKP